jgi:cytochrome c oxidase subunit II
VLAGCLAALAWLVPDALAQAASGRYGWWLPPNVSTVGGPIDRIFYVILIVTGVVCVLVQGALVIFLVKYRARPGGRAHYTHGNNRLELIWTAVPAIFLAGLALVSQQVWGEIKPSAGFRGAQDGAGDPVIIEIVAQQFAWNIRYPGADGVFGRRDVARVSGTNLIGLDPTDPASADDILSPNQLHIPVGRQIQVRLTSKDVLHSFFLPDFRVKQDAVPGMQINVFFDALEAGNFEIACAELCGLQHYYMKGYVTVHESDDAFNAWLAEKAPAHAE